MKYARLSLPAGYLFTSKNLDEYKNIFGHFLKYIVSFSEV